MKLGEPLPGATMGTKALTRVPGVILSRISGLCVFNIAWLGSSRSNMLSDTEPDEKEVLPSMRHLLSLPVPVETMTGRLSIRQETCGKSVTSSGVNNPHDHVATMPLVLPTRQHSQEASALRIHQDTSLCP